MPELARPRSLRRHLLAVLLLSLSAAWVAAAGVSYADARREVNELMDGHLTQTASLVIAQWEASPVAGAVEHAPPLHPYGVQVMFQIWEGGALGLHSLSAPNTRLSPTTEGFDDTVIGGARWRVFSAWNAGHTTLVQVAEQYEERNEIVSALARNFVVPVLVALPVLALLVWGAVGRATRSLTRVSAEVTGRAPDSLEPLVAAGAPTEIEALVAALNGLFARMRESIERERQFTANAAHELRTPLAAIRAQAQVARAATDGGERAHALDQVVAGCDRGSRLVDQMLTLARLEAMSLQPAACGLRDVLRDALIEIAPSALAKGVEIELADGPAVTVTGDAGLLRVLFRNLVDNAVRYCPRGAHVAVAIDPGAEAAVVTVTDDGPGLSEEDRAALGRRFRRPAGSKEPGSGLGVSIAERIVGIHGGQLRFDAAPGGRGLQATVTLPVRR